MRDSPIRAIVLMVATFGLAACDPPRTSSVRRTIAAPEMPRLTADSPDETDEFKFHVIYAVPKSATDKRFDVDGTIVRAVERCNTWFSRESGGEAIRFDMIKGKPDVTFLPIDEILPATNSARLDRLEELLERSGLTRTRKSYLVFYDGPNQNRGTAGGWGRQGLALVELDQCPTVFCRFGPVDDYSFEKTAVHEMLHALGAVPEGAPHRFKDQGHTSDLAQDIMNANPSAAGPRSPVKLDPGRDDYFGHRRNDLWDVARSAYLDPLPADVVPPRGTQLALAAGQNAIPFRFPLETIAAAGVPELEAALEAELAGVATGKFGKAPRRDERLVNIARILSQSLAEGKSGEERTALIAKGGYHGGWRYVTSSPRPAVAASGSAVIAADMVARDFATTDFEAVSLGVGAYQTAEKIWVSVMTGTALFRYENLELGEGPFKTYTLSGTLRADAEAATGTLEVRVWVGGNRTFKGKIEPGGTMKLLVDFPRNGTYRADVFADSKFLASFFVNGALPLDQAPTFDAPASPSTWPRDTWY